MPDITPQTLPPAARWAAVLLLGGAGLVGIARGLLSPQPPRLPAHPAAFTTPESTLPSTRADPASDEPTLPAAATSPTRRININTATAAELDLLPGIGPALAGRIIDHRHANGPYRSLDDLDDVSGIGPKTIAKLVPYATAE